MITKILVLVFLAAAVSSNPAANQEWKWIERTLTVDPAAKHLPIPKDVFKSKVHKPRQSRPRVTVDGCGTAPLVGRISHDPKIVGGSEATPHAYPWQAALFIDDMYFCGGSVISDEWILTAAHCMDGAQSVEVVLGAHNIQEAEASQQTFVSTDFFTHEDYQSAVVHNDLALIRLPSTLTFDDYIQPVCLPSGSDLGEGVDVTPTGWGKTKDGIGSISDVLNEVTDPTVLDSVCSDYYGSLIINGNQICIDTTGGHGTCNGDSGGPLNHKTSTGIYETRGITSFGSSEGCTSGAPAAFTRVNHYLDWIETNSGVTSSKK